jgi:membrane protein
MEAMKRLLHAVDAFQQRQPWLAFPIAAWKKFGDDQAGNLAALIAYYAFASIFPLLLVLVTVLDIVVQNNPALKQHVLDSALASFPVIGPQLSSNVHSLQATGIALVIGLVGTFLGAQGVANAVQNALNSAWEVPFSERPGFPWSLLRNLGMIVFVGTGEIATVILSGVAGGAGHLLTGAGGHIGTVAVSLILNIGLFWLAFRLATARQVTARDLRLGAVLAAIAWQALQILGSYLVSHSLAKESSLYGVFGIVLGLIAWLYLQAQITLYAVEINVVHTLRLWPRSLTPPPLTEQDVRAYELYARVTQRRPGLEIDLHSAADPPASDAGPEQGASEAGRVDAAGPEKGGPDRQVGKQAASHPE